MISLWFTQILFRMFRLPINHSMAKLQCFLQKLKQAFPTHHLQYPCQAMSLRQQEHPSQLYLCIIQLPKVGYLRFIKVRKLNILAQIIANMLCDHQGLHPQQLLARISLLPKRWWLKISVTILQRWRGSIHRPKSMTCRALKAQQTWLPNCYFVSKSITVFCSFK